MTKEILEKLIVGETWIEYQGTITSFGTMITPELSIMKDIKQEGKYSLVKITNDDYKEVALTDEELLELIDLILVTAEEVNLEKGLVTQE